MWDGFSCMFSAGLGVRVLASGEPVACRMTWKEVAGEEVLSGPGCAVWPPWRD